MSSSSAEIAVLEVLPVGSRGNVPLVLPPSLSILSQRSDNPL